MYENSGGGIACLHGQNKSAFFQPIRAFSKLFNFSDWLDNNRPPKKPLLFDLVCTFQKI